jgi:hypothetical protein
LEEIELAGRRFTCSNEHVAPTLELLDRTFASSDWFAAFPCHGLKPLSTDCSDHCPTMLHVLGGSRAKRRFRFEPFWATIPGYAEVVSSAWQAPVEANDPFRVIDLKLRNVARELRRWSNSKIGSIRLHLAMVREVILAFDK